MSYVVKLFSIRKKQNFHYTLEVLGYKTGLMAPGFSC